MDGIKGWMGPGSKDKDKERLRIKDKDKRLKIKDVVAEGAPRRIGASS
jgi:hypothetical protein